MPTLARWVSLVLAALAIALVIGGSAGLVLSVRGAAGWEVENPLALFGGALLMSVTATVGVLLARSAWRDEARPTVAIAGLSLVLLLAVAGAHAMTRAVVLFPGPLPVVTP